MTGFLSRMASLIITGLWFVCQGYSQGIEVKGVVVDAVGLPMSGAGVRFTYVRDTTIFEGVATEMSGHFYVLLPSPGMWRMEVTYVGYETHRSIQQIKPGGGHFLQVQLKEHLQVIEGAVVEGLRRRVEQKGDTTIFNADAYKTNPDADASDLLEKLPGVVKEGGSFKVQGESVRKVLLDGKEYFGEDAVAALKNIPTEMIDKVQVFDEQSEQSRFTGFDDGNSQKAINIITKSGYDQSRLGKGYVGYGTDGRYLTGANMNMMGKGHRLALIGIANNVNIQNFSDEDISGVVNSSGGRGMGMQGRPSGGQWGRGDNDLTVPQQNGITSAYGFGANYNGQWGKATKVSSSYFVNRSDNEMNRWMQKELFLGGEQTQRYDETQEKEQIRYHHKWNARLEWNPDSFQSIVFRPRISYQQGRVVDTIFAVNSIGRTPIPLSTGALINELANDMRSSQGSASLSGELLYRRRLKKEGRTVSLSLKPSWSDQWTRDSLDAEQVFFLNPSANTSFGQVMEGVGQSSTYTADLSVTEKVGAKGQLMLTYSPGVSYTSSERKVRRLDAISGEYVYLDTILSNDFLNHIQTHKGGVSYQINPNGQWRISFGVWYQHSMLIGEGRFPTVYVDRYRFPAVLPHGRINYKINQQSNVLVQYRSFTRLPGAQQLQPVIENSNPMQLFSGNADLTQEVRHFGFLRYGFTGLPKGRSFFIFSGGTAISQFLTNESWISMENGFEPVSGVVLNRGVSYSRPVNMDGYISWRNYASYGLPARSIKGNVNLNVGYNRSEQPGRINGISNNTLTHNVNTGVVMSSNRSEKLDFTASYSLQYHMVRYRIQQVESGDFFFQNASLRVQWLPWKGLVISSETFYSGYDGLADGFNRAIWLWNGGIGYKFLKEQRGELKITVFDVLNQNNHISRMVTEQYIQDSEVMVLRRFFLLNFTYRFRHIGKASVSRGR
jgi:hypothetical protein